jgi:3-deoxy-D-manno-octulosonate 8-phosphate phosphatase (KDO 8-P phosphatase)
MQEIYERAKRVRLAVFDVDGVLTEGGLAFAAGGEETKVFNVLDGHGMRLLQDSGVKLAVITSRSSRAVEERMRNLGVALLVQGVHDKLAVFRELAAREGIAAEAAACIGDDLQDLPVLRCCGLAATVPGAPALVRRHAHYVTRARGGHGAAREWCDLLMHAQGTLAARHAAFLR